MFGISGPEFVLIAVLALLVLGPERLPEFARTVGGFLSKLRRNYTNIRDQFERELELDALRAELRKHNSATPSSAVTEPAPLPTPPLAKTNTAPGNGLAQGPDGTS